MIFASVGYIGKRYGNTSDLVKAYHTGEDMVFAIDAIVSIITIVKAVSGAGQKLPKFTRWVDGIFERNPRVLNAVEELPERRLINEVDNGKIKLDEFADGKKRKPKDFTRQSNYAEIKARLTMESNTFRIGKNEGTLKYISLDKVTDLDAPIRKGIDAVYEFSTPPPKYVVAEVKMNTTGSRTWKPKVDTKVTASGGSQMTDNWIKFNLETSVSEDIFQDILIKGYDSLLIGISKENDVIFQTLNIKAKVVKNNINIVE